MIATNTDLTRNEILIVIKYLLECSDKDHPVFQNKVVEYALTHFNHEMRRQRVRETLEFLYSIKDNGFLPFSVNRKQTPEKYKYYVEKRELSNDEIVKVIDSIKQNKYLADEVVDDLVNKVLTLHASENEKQSILNATNKDSFLIHKYSKKILKLNDALHDAQVNKDIITLIVKANQLDFDISIDTTSLLFMESKSESGVGRFKVRGYIYKVVEFDDNLYAICGIIAVKRILTVPLQRIEIVKSEKSYGIVPSLHELVPDFKYDSIEKFLEETVVPGSRFVHPIKFAFENDKEDIKLETVKSLFERHFKKVMKYERTIETKTMFGPVKVNGRLVRKYYEKSTEIIKVRVKVPIRIFVNWAYHPELLGKINIERPTIIDELLRSQMQSISEYYNKKVESNKQESLVRRAEHEKRRQERIRERENGDPNDNN